MSKPSAARLDLPETPNGANAASSGAAEAAPQAAEAASDGAEAAPDAGPEPQSDLVVVGIGASAGGLAALRTFFSHVPEDSGVAWVVVVHLSPEHKSHLADVLQPYVRMPVQQVTGTLPLEPDHVYVIPPGANLTSVDTHLRLTKLEQARRERAPVDHFLRTLSATHDGHSVGVILTGSGSDGALGIRAIKDKAGLTIVQDPEQAEYDGMPQSALITGMVDLVLPLEKIPAAILSFARTQPRIAITDDEAELEAEQQRLLQKVYAQIRAQTGRDFTRYRRSTVLRRIQRRMQIGQVERLDAYLQRLRADPEEVRALADDLLVTVTNFFRDAEVWQRIENDIIPAILAGKRADDTVRVWSVGCATGEEAYSLAMVLMERAAQLDMPPRIQVFASDLHERSLQRAREGFYPGDIEADISEARLQRFFQKEDGGYRIRKEVREPVVFAQHDLMGDPPFSGMDLIVCRNVLIYLQREVQRHVIDLFHYALVPDGRLVLGTSETVDSAERFRLEDKAACIYRKRNVRAREPHLPVFPITRPRRLGDAQAAEPIAAPIVYGQLHQRIVEQFGPPSMLVNPDDKVVHLSERAGRYLVHPGGEMTASAFRLVREELRIELRTALRLAREKGHPVRSKPIKVQFDGGARPVILDMRPGLGGGEQEGFVLVIFDERFDDVPTQEIVVGDGGDAAAQDVRVRELEEELAMLRQRLQGIVEEYETSQEEMRASHEELQSSNEELRSTLEELETSKEELQSMNEELQTVNQENRHRVEELAQLSGDLQNLLSATDIATLFLDNDLRIMRFTPKVADLFNVRPVDRGRPLSDLTHRLDYAELEDDAARILERPATVEREVADEDGNWYLAHLLPYRGAHDRIDGVVVTFVDITALRRGAEALRESEASLRSLTESLAMERGRLEAVLQNLPVGVWIADQQGRLVSKNEQADRIWSGDAPLSRGVDEYTRYEAWDVRTGKPLAAEEYPVARALELNEPVEPLELRIRRFDGSDGTVLVSAAPVRDADGALLGAVGINVDISQRARLEEVLREAKDAAERANTAKSQFLGVISHELRTPLNAVIGFADMMRAGLAGPVSERQGEYLGRIESCSWNLVAIIDEILAYTRSEAGKAEVFLATADVTEVMGGVVDMLGDDAGARGLDLEFLAPGERMIARTDAGKLRQILTNLTGNALKYTIRGGVRLEVQADDEWMTFRVHDTGPGIPTDRLEDIFEPFVQLDSSPTRAQGGTGLGLSVARRHARLLGGDVIVERTSPAGSTFTARIPRRLQETARKRAE
jgi:two-component system, chemotaxis family, CheB/CheR fusion protein